MVVTQKKHLRILMKEKRTLLFQQHPDVGHKITTLFFEAFDFRPPMILGGYWPIGSELDVRPLLKELMERGFQCALPRITPEGLEFHLWTESIPLIKGAFQVFEPASTTVVVPDVLLVPLLAFDKRGHRLGYGQGHFDRYLHHHSVMTVGIGFKGQELEEAPHEPHDIVLDCILTEEGLVS